MMEKKELLMRCWIEHSCGTWKVGSGDTIGATMIKTSSMGKAFGTRHKINDFLSQHPSMTQLTFDLLLANEKQLLAA